jgi:hypothetical protein
MAAAGETAFLIPARRFTPAAPTQRATSGATMNRAGTAIAQDTRHAASYSRFTPTRPAVTMSDTTADMHTDSATEITTER